MAYDASHHLAGQREWPKLCLACSPLLRKASLGRPSISFLCEVSFLLVDGSRMKSFGRSLIFAALRLVRYDFIRQYTPSFGLVVRLFATLRASLPKLGVFLLDLHLGISFLTEGDSLASLDGLTLYTA